jgi:UDP-glucose 4-epimerase
MFGNDYNTPDGTCIRDYINVLDLASAHEKAVNYLKQQNRSLEVNLGVGQGYSNMEIIKKIEKITGEKIDIISKPRRFGDPDMIYADNAMAKKILGWNPKFSIEETIESAWKFYKKINK